MDTKSTYEMLRAETNGAVYVPLEIAARLIGVSPRTIRNGLSTGRWDGFPVRKLSGGQRGRWFVRLYDLAKWLDDGSRRRGQENG